MYHLKETRKSYCLAVFMYYIYIYIIELDAVQSVWSVEEICFLNCTKWHLVFSPQSCPNPCLFAQIHMN